MSRYREWYAAIWLLSIAGAEIYDAASLTSTFFAGFSAGVSSSSRALLLVDEGASSLLPAVAGGSVMLWFRLFSPFSIALGASSEVLDNTCSMTGVSAGVLDCGLASSPESGVEVRILGTPLRVYQ